jgi:hypothetical protein
MYADIFIAVALALLINITTSAFEARARRGIE